MNSALRLRLWQFGALLAKDLRRELRGRQIWIGMVLFALLVLVVFNFAFDLRVETTVAVAPGALWIAFVFASVLGLGRAVAAELDHGSMDRLLLCPVDRSVIYLAKLAGNLLFLGALEVITVPIFAALYNLPILSAGLVPVVALGTLGIAAVGTSFSFVAASTRASEALLPILIFPLLVPVVIAGVKATQALITPVSASLPWLGLLVAFDAMFLSVSALTFRYLVEE